MIISNINNKWLIRSSVLQGANFFFILKNKKLAVNYERLAALDFLRDLLFF